MRILHFLGALFVKYYTFYADFLAQFKKKQYLRGHRSRYARPPRKYSRKMQPMFQNAHTFFENTASLCESQLFTYHSHMQASVVAVNN